MEELDFYDSNLGFFCCFNPIANYNPQIKGLLKPILTC